MSRKRILSCNLTMNSCLHCGEPAKNTYCSLSCSNFDRLRKNELKYMKNPKLCLNCNEPVPYKARAVNIFCSSSCAAKVNNKLVVKRAKLPPKEGPRKMTVEEKFKAGEIQHRKTMRKCLISSVGNFCAICAIPGFWNEKPMTLIVDHIDGNAGNNMPENLRLLCPNCNSQTDTFCGRNFGNGRTSRGLPKN